MHSGGNFGGGGRGGGGFTSNSNSGNFGGGPYQHNPQNNSSRNAFVNRSSYVVVGTPGSVYSGAKAYSAPPPVLVSQGPKMPAWLTLRPLVDVGIVVGMRFGHHFSGISIDWVKRATLD